MGGRADDGVLKWLHDDGPGGLTSWQFETYIAELVGFRIVFFYLFDSFEYFQHIHWFYSSIGI